MSALTVWAAIPQKGKTMRKVELYERLAYYMRAEIAELKGQLQVELANVRILKREKEELGQRFDAIARRRPVASTGGVIDTQEAIKGLVGTAWSLANEPTVLSPESVELPEWREPNV